MSIKIKKIIAFIVEITVIGKHNAQRNIKRESKIDYMLPNLAYATFAKREDMQLIAAVNNISIEERVLFQKKCIIVNIPCILKNLIIEDQGVILNQKKEVILQEDIEEA